jgi:hypothetical protein
MSIREDFAPFKDPIFLLTLAILCGGIAVGGAIMKYLAT